MSVYSQSNANPNDFPQKLIGEILREAGLISSPQLQTALKTQIKYSDFRLGEIIVSQGWLQQKTIDFLVDVFSRCNLHKYLSKQPIGYYLQEAGLLTGEQIDTLVQEQKNLNIKFCYLAVIKGFLRPKTADFFLDHVATRFSVSPTINSSVSDEINQAKSIMTGENTPEQMSQNSEVNDENENDNVFFMHDRDIQSTPIYIDL